MRQKLTAADEKQVALSRTAAKIEANKRARLSAQAIIELIDEEVKNAPDHAKEVLASLIFEHIYNWLLMILIFRPWQHKVLPMTDVQAKAFGKGPMPYGEFMGQSIDSIPIERLNWYAEQGFQDDLRRYLASRRIKREIAATEAGSEGQDDGED